MSMLGLLCLLFALIAALILVLYGLQRRELRSMRSCRSSCCVSPSRAFPERLDLGSDKPEIAGLVTAVNHLLARVARGAERDATQAPRLFADLATAFTRQCWCMVR